MVTSLPQYLIAIENLRIPDSDFSSTTLPWYRGQADSTWHLVPSIYRGDCDKEREREMSRDFRLRAHLDIEHTPTTYLGWLFVMQHYGMPTRLLDWTESSLVALYFAVEDFSRTSNAAVWVMHPWTLNKNAESYGQQSVPQLSKDIDDLYWYPMNTVLTQGQAVRVKKNRPMALRPAHTTRRIVAQRGQFTVHGHDTIGLDQVPQMNLDLFKVEIDGRYKLTLLRQLYKVGVSRYTIFPDLTGLSHELRVRYSKEFMR